jgi:SAM-dependent methyltransferase
MTGLVELADIPCPLCGAGRYEVRLESVDLMHGIPGEFRVVRCLDCRHVSMNPQPTPDTVLFGYPDQYGPHAAMHGESSSRAPAQAESSQPAGAQAKGDSTAISQKSWYLRPSVRRIPGLRSLYYWLTDTRGDFIPPRDSPTPTALELGCATGTFLKKLRADGWNAQGVEPVSPAAAVARREGFDVHVGTLESAGFANSTFDAVFGWMVIEHLNDPRSALQEMARITRPAGWLGISIPNFGCWEPTVFGRYWYLWELPRHLHFFTPKRIRRLVEECGFDRVQVVHQRNSLNLVGSVGLFLRRCFPRSRLARRILEWPDHPTTWWQLALAPLAIALATVRQGGRLLVIARRKADQTSKPTQE